jgi:hypothetical protein
VPAVKFVRSKFFRRLTAGVIVLAVSGAAAGLGGAVAHAAPAALGTLALDPASGSDLDTPNVTTSGGCPAPADRYQVLVNGPNLTNYPMRPIATDGFSSNGPIATSFGVSMKDAAADQGTGPITAGQYDVTFQCLQGLQSTLVGKYTTAMIFTSPTSYHTSTSTTTTTSTASTTTSATATSTTTTSTTAASTTAASTTSDSATSPPATTTSDIGGATTTSGPGGGTQPLGTSDTLAKTGVPIGLIFLGGLIVLATGLALVLWLQRRRKAALGEGGDTAGRPAKSDGGR